MIAALFDFDGTLYTGHVWQDLVRHHRAARRSRFWTVAYVAWNMAPLPLYKAGLISREAFYHAWGETMGWLLHGWTLTEAQGLFERLTEEQIVPNLRPDVLERLHQHRAEGPPLEVRDGRYTGRIVPPLCQGGGKPHRVQTYLAERSLQVDWAASFAYADRDTDIPLLSLVGRPVAVYPDDGLKAHAQAHGWPVMVEAGP
jgi:phosphoserine phosphatase